MKRSTKISLLVILIALLLAQLACDDGTNGTVVKDLDGNVVDMTPEQEHETVNPIDAIGDAVCNIDQDDCHHYDNSKDVLQEIADR